MSAREIDPKQFQLFNRLMIALYRLGLGPYLSNDLTGHILVLITRGRKTGLKRQTPVNYAWDGPDAVYCTPGTGARSDWYRNLQAQPYVEMWIGNEWWSGIAHTVTDPDEWLAAYRQVLIASGFAAERFLGINPHTISDDALRQHADEPIAVRITLDTRLYGPGGPGDRRWVWPIVLLIALRLRRHWRNDDDR